MYVCMPACYVCSMAEDRWGGGVGRNRAECKSKKKKKKCGRLQKIAVVLCKGDDSVRL